MAISERTLKRVRDFLNPNLKAKHRYASLQDFHEYASELEKVEFFERHGDTLSFFLFECYVACLSKIWIAPAEEAAASSRDSTTALWFAFGVKDSAELGKDEALVLRLGDLVSRLKPAKMASRAAFESSLRHDNDPANVLRFPVVFSWLLKYYSGTNLIVNSALAVPLICLIRRVVARENAPALQIEGIRMLLSLMKVCSYTEDEKAVHVRGICEEMLTGLVELSSLMGAAPSVDEDTPVLDDEVSAEASQSSSIEAVSSEAADTDAANHAEPEEVEAILPPLLRGKRGPLSGTGVFNEILAFLTWDANADLHSSRYLYGVLRDKLLILMYADAWDFVQEDPSRDLIGFKLAEGTPRPPVKVQSLIVEYLSIWLLKSTANIASVGSFAQQSARTGHVISSETSGNTFGAAVAAFLGLKRSSGSKSPNSSLRAASPTSATSSSSLKIIQGDLPMASFLLEEIILSATMDIKFVHLILRILGASYAAQHEDAAVISNGAVKLELEIFRSWIFNPPGRRPSFLANDEDTIRFLRFYLASLRDLFLSKAVVANEAIEIQREALYFYRAVALQAFIVLNTSLWEFLIAHILEIIESGTQADESLLMETLLGCLIRAGESSARDSTGIVECWRRTKAILTNNFAAGNRVAVEEWSRVIEAIGLLLVRDPMFTTSSKMALSYPTWAGTASRSPTSSTLSSVSSSNASVNASSMLQSVSSAGTGRFLSPTSSLGSLPAAMAHFSAWPDLGTVRRTCLFLFRNLLRLPGDFGAGVDALHATGRMSVLTSVLSMLERVSCSFLRLRQGQALKTNARHIPPFGDLLVAALSALLQLTKIDCNDEPYVMARVLAWRMVGSLLFRPVDFPIPSTHWGSLMACLRAFWRNERVLSVVELRTVLEFISVPLSIMYPLPAVSLAGTKVSLSGVAVRIFAEDELLAKLLSDGRSAATLLQFVTNCVQLSALASPAMASYRDCTQESSFLRLLQVISRFINRESLDVLISAVTSILMSEAVRSDAILDAEFVDGLVALFLQVCSAKLQAGLQTSEHSGTIRLSRSDVNAIVTAFTSLAVLQVSISETSRALFTDANLCQIVHGLLDILSIAMSNSSQELDASLLASRLMEEALPAFFLYALPFDFLREHADVRDRLVQLSCPAVSGHSASREQWLQLFLATAAMPYDLMRAKAFSAHVSWAYNIAVNPGRVILSFGTRKHDLKVIISMRSAVGRFEWVCEPVYQGAAARGAASSGDDMKGHVLHGEIVSDDEFSVGAAAFDAKRLAGYPDQLKVILGDLQKHFPQCQLKGASDEVVGEIGWREQSARESEYVSRQRQHRELLSASDGARVPDASRVCSLETKASVLLRLMIVTLGLGLPELSGLGVSMLPRECKFDALDALEICPKISISSWLDGLVPREDADYNSLIEELFVRDAAETSLCTPMFDMVLEPGPDGPILLCWHGSIESLESKNPSGSALTRVLIHIVPVLRGQWYLVSRQVKHTKGSSTVLSPRLSVPSVTARHGQDPFSTAAVESIQDYWSSSGMSGGSAPAITDTANVEGFGVLVPRGVLGAFVRSMVLLSDAEAESLSAPITERQRVLDEIMSQNEAGDGEVRQRALPVQSYDQFLAQLFPA